MDSTWKAWDSVSLSLCMHNMLRACLLTAQFLYSRLREHIHQRIPYVYLSRACLVWTNQSVPSLSCLDKPISVFLTSVRPEPPACALAFVLAAMLLRSRFCAPLPSFLLAIAPSLSAWSFFSFIFCCVCCAWSVYASVISAIRLKLRVSIDRYRPSYYLRALIISPHPTRLP